MLESIEQQFRATSAGRWFFGREPNERLVIAGLAVLIVITFVWLGVFKPLSDWHMLEENRRHNAQNALDWLHLNEQRAREMVAQQSNTRGGGARIPVITRTARSNGLKLSRLQPESGSTAVNVVLEEQPFNSVLAWLHQLQRNNGVQVVRITVNGEDAPGYVNAQVKLQ
ncbi:MAG: type II secretion system protein M [Pseudomonadales bacterium]|jgi:general secretion pathway protein M|nr:type II secretion system protein M [Pseudomonadales bacterium]MDP6473029.1 type II secretion system protein M [Pseudomonadales bacterium]MDP6826214.1 type II secretion system protein M [Pseudomonadales bacterium]MDP6973327.1 type II secretion system protein M [Pseudomonadales bacterium]